MGGRVIGGLYLAVAAACYRGGLGRPGCSGTGRGKGC